MSKCFPWKNKELRKTKIIKKINFKKVEKIEN